MPLKTMSVIKEEFINSRITRYDVLPISFLKKSAYTGSKGKLRYRMARTEIGEEEDKKTVLRVWSWTTPFAFDKTPEEEMQICDFSFDEEGLSQTIEHLNEVLNSFEA